MWINRGENNLSSGESHEFIGQFLTGNLFYSISRKICLEARMDQAELLKAKPNPVDGRDKYDHHYMDHFSVLLFSLQPLHIPSILLAFHTLNLSNI